MEQMAGTKMQSCGKNSTSPHTSHKSTHILLNKTKEVPRVGNIWIPYSSRSPNHFTKFFIPEIEVLFQSGDMILKVEASNLSS
jgi:hypothetical protein